MQRIRGVAGTTSCPGRAATKGHEVGVAFPVEPPLRAHAPSLRQATVSLKPLVAAQPGRQVFPATPREHWWTSQQDHPEAIRHESGGCEPPGMSRRVLDVRPSGRHIDSARTWSARDSRRLRASRVRERRKRRAFGTDCGRSHGPLLTGRGGREGGSGAATSGRKPPSSAAVAS